MLNGCKESKSIKNKRKHKKKMLKVRQPSLRKIEFKIIHEWVNWYFFGLYVTKLLIFSN